MQDTTHRSSDYGRWTKINGDWFFIASQAPPEEKGCPLPNTSEGRAWWEDQAQYDLDATFDTCVRLYNAGCKWAGKLGEWLIDRFA